MTKLRRLVAVVLAALMVLGSMSVAAFAWDATVDDGFTLGLSTKIFRQVNGQWIETTKVNAGENVKARVYIDTDYYAGSGKLLLFYNSNFFSDSYSANEQTLSVNSFYAANPYGIDGNFYSSASTSPIETRMVNNGFITQQFADDHNYFQVSYFFGVNSTVQNFSDDNWFCEFDLTVKNNATGTGEFLFVPATVASPTATAGAISVSKGQAGTYSIFTSAMHLWNANTAISNASVALFTNFVSLTFASNGGSFAAADTTTYVVEGDAGDPIGELPAITKSNHVLAGWADANIADPDPTQVFAAPTNFPSASADYKAVWSPVGGAQDGDELYITTKIFRYDADAGEWVEADRVAPGEQVKARVYLDTAYFTNAGEFVIFYDNDFFSDSYTGISNPLALNTASGSDAVEYGMAGYFACSQSSARQVSKLVSNGFITQEFADEHNFFGMTFEFDRDETNHKLVSGLLTEDPSDDEWLCEFDLTVRNDASGMGDVFAVESTFANSTDRFLAYGNIPRGEENGINDSIGMFLWDAQITIESNPVYTDSSVTLDANTGAFDAEDANLFVFEGPIGSAIDQSQIPEISKPGCTFMGWYSADVAEPTLDDIVELPATMPYDDEVYKAMWIQQVSVILDPANGDALEVRTVTPGDPFEPVETPEREGYTFIRWNPLLPEVYPDVETTYTAVWEKKVYDVNYYVLDPNLMSFVKIGTIPHEYDEPIATMVPTYVAPEGYTISAAFTDIGFTQVLPAGETMPANAVNLYFRLAAGVYDANFYLLPGDTTPYAVVPTAYDAAISVPADPTREGYSFFGWEPLVGLMDETGKDFVATWSANEYNINYYVDGVLTDTYSVEFGDELDFVADPYKEGYEFLGWDDDAEATTALTVFPDSMPANDLNYYAVFEAIEYTLELDAGEGTFADNESSKEFTQEFGTDIDAPADPTREGYTFDGWLNGDVPAEIPETMPAENLSLTANWVVNTYDVTYMVNGEVYEMIPAEYGAAVPTPAANPELEGNTFTGWTPEAPTTMPAEDLTFIAVFEVNSYDISFSAAGGYFNGDETATADIVDTLDYNAAITVPTVAKTGYVFAGWAVNDNDNLSVPGFADVVQVPTNMPASDLAFEAVWTPANDTPYVIYTYTMDTAGVYQLTSTQNLEGTTGATVYATTAVFTGFYIDTVAPYESVLSATIAADGSTELYIYYARKSYTVTFDAGVGGVIPGPDTQTTADTYFYAATVTAPEDPVKEGYTFVRWNPTVSPAYGTVTYYAEWDIDSHDAIFYTEAGTAYATEAYDYGAAIAEPTAPTKTGYTFAGWSYADSDPLAALASLGNMGTEDVEFMAIWTVNSYDAAFDSGDGYFNGDPTDTEETVSVNYGEEITVPSEPARPGYEFGGWADPADPETPVDFDNNPPVMDEDGAEFIAIWTAQEQAYITELYTMGTDGNYGTPATQTLQAETGATVTFNLPMLPTGFYLSTEAPYESVLEGVIPAEGTLVLKAYRARESYTLTVSVDGAVTQDDEHLYGSAISVTEPTKTGYVFAGWVDLLGNPVTIPATMPANDILVFATWELDEFTITYVGNGGTVDGIDTIEETYEYNAIIGAAPEFTRTGYTFTGWDNEVPVLMPAEDITLTALWSANSYDAVFDSGDGYFNDDPADTEETVPVEYGEEIDPPADPARPGYEFGGWADPDDPETPVDFDTNPPAMDENGAEYIAIWTANDDTVFNVRANYVNPANGQTVTTLVEFSGTSDANVYIVESVPETPEDGAVYVLYSELPTFTSYVFDPTDARNELSGVIAGDGSLVLDVYYICKQYTATFDSTTGVFEGGATTIAMDPIDYYSLVVAPTEEPTREGYVFAGWQGFTAGTTRLYTDMTFYAIWTIGEFTVTFDAGEGYFGDDETDHTESYTGEYETAVTFPADPTREGYTFGGWTDGTTTYEEPYNMAVPSEDITLTAVWDANTYTVTYMEDDTTVWSGPTDAVFGSVIPTPETTPTKPDYNFLRWVDENGHTPSYYGTMPSNDLVFTAEFTARTGVGYFLDIYEMDINGNYPTTPTSTIEFNDGTVGEARAVNPTAPEGFTRKDALSTLTGTIPAAPDTLRLEVFFERNSYTITTTVEGVETAYDYLFGAPVTPIADPVKTGYVFTGWVTTGTDEAATVPAIMPANDVNIEATFDVDSFDAVFSAGEGSFEGNVPSQTVSVEYNQPVTPPADVPTRDGYTFEGWATPDAPDTAIDFVANPQIMDENGKEYIAIWAASDFTVTYHNYITGPASSPAMYVYQQDTVEFGTAIVLPTEPSIEYYVFTGWVYDGDTPFVAGMEMPARDLDVYATYSRIPVMLIPKNETCTTVIDRNGGTVDDYVAGVSQWFVYGLEIDLTEEILLNEYIDVQGDGIIDVISVPNQSCGTGAIIRVYDRITGELVESFFIVVFGDLNGDARVTTADTVIVRDENFFTTSWSVPSDPTYKPYWIMAADLAKDGVIDSVDLNESRNVVLADREIDQVNGTVIYD